MMCQERPFSSPDNVFCDSHILDCIFSAKADCSNVSVTIDFLFFL